MGDWPGRGEARGDVGGGNDSWGVRDGGGVDVRERDGATLFTAGRSRAAATAVTAAVTTCPTLSWWATGSWRTPAVGGSCMDTTAGSSSSVAASGSSHRAGCCRPGAEKQSKNRGMPKNLTVQDHPAHRHHVYLREQPCRHQSEPKIPNTLKFVSGRGRSEEQR